MSPMLRIDVRSYVYVAERREVYIKAVQIFHIRWSPFAGHPSR